MNSQIHDTVRQLMELHALEERFGVAGRPVGFMNTGSFLCNRDGTVAEVFAGGDVFHYDRSGGVRSTRV